MGRCYNTIEISSPIGEVWRKISNFHDMSWATGVITSVEKIGDKSADQIGAKRVLNNAFHETLTEFSPEKFSFSYRIDDGPGPVAKGAVNNYIGKVKLSENNGICLVEWSSSYESTDDVAVSEFCDPIYQALLNALKHSLSK